MVVSGSLHHGDPRRTSCFLPLYLLAVVLLAAAGCASAPPYRTHPELPQRKGGIRSVGLLPPVVSLSEERPRFGLNKVVLQSIWSSVAVEAVSRAFAEEMAADHITLVPIGTDDAEVKDLSALYGAVEFSLLRHAWEREGGSFPPGEPFPEKVRSFDYSLGSAEALVDRLHVDAIWIVHGFNLLPTIGATMKDGAEILLSVLGGLGGVPSPVMTLQKIELRVALVDRTGNILYYGVADDRTALPEGGEPDSASKGEGAHVAVDLRDPRAARHYVRAALAGYRAAGAR